MTDPKKAIQGFQTTHWIIKNQTKGLNHADSVLQLPFRGNCMNWVVGHLAVYRDKMLKVIGQEGLLNEEETALYTRGSDPIINADYAVAFERLLNAIDESQKRIIAYLEQATTDTLAAIYKEEQTVGDRLGGLHWHETYHTGQLELLCQLAGTNDVIIK